MYVSTFWISNSNPTLIRLALLDSSDKLILSCAFRAPPNYTNSEPLLLSPSHSYSESFRYSTLFQRVPATWFVTSVRNTLDVTEGRHSTRAEAISRKPPNFRISGLDFRRIRVAWATRNNGWLMHSFMSSKWHPALQQRTIWLNSRCLQAESALMTPHLKTYMFGVFPINSAEDLCSGYSPQWLGSMEDGHLKSRLSPPKPYRIETVHWPGKPDCWTYKSNSWPDQTVGPTKQLAWPNHRLPPLLVSLCTSQLAHRHWILPLLWTLTYRRHDPKLRSATTARKLDISRTIAQSPTSSRPRTTFQKRKSRILLPKP